MFDEIKKLIDGYLKNDGIPGCDCTVFYDGKCVFRYGGGYSDKDKTVPTDGTERYYFYSASKFITCTAMLKLIEDGKAGLDDPLYLYLPEFKNIRVRGENGWREPKSPILLKHLFTMTAGFSYDVFCDSIQKYKTATDGKAPTLGTMKAFASDGLWFDPGTNWNYSLCHDILAAVCEVITGMTFNEYVKKIIFEPLCMTHSSYNPKDHTSHPLAAEWAYNGTTKEYTFIDRQNIYIIGSEYESGGAGLVSTVDDYINFLEALRTGRIIKPETVRDMATNRLPEKLVNAPAAILSDLDGYGYGLGVRCPKDGRFEDFGWKGAAGTCPLVYLDRKISVLYCQHVLGSPNYNRVTPEIDRIIRRL